MPAETEKTTAPTVQPVTADPESSAFSEGSPIFVEGPLVNAEPATPLSKRNKFAAVFTVGVVVSALAHVLFLLWAIGSFASVEELAEVEVIPVELVSEEEEEESLALSPPSDEEPSQPEPTAPSPPQNDTPDDLPAEPAANAAAPTSEERPADAPPAETVETPLPTEPQPENAPTSELSELLESLGFAVSDQPLDQSVEAGRTIATQVRRCWEAPTGWSEPRQASVTVRFLLNRDGTVKGDPAVIEFHASLIGKAAADNAVRAVFECAPFTVPQDTYEQWKDVQVRLTP